MTACKILLVDDDPVYRTLGAEELGSHGYEVTEAPNGAAALEMICRQPFDIVISDLEMPIMTGVELLKEIRADERGSVAELPFLMITGRGDIDAVRRAFDFGATSFVQKPVNWLTVVHHIEFVLRASEQTIALRLARDKAKKALDSKNAVLMALRHELRSPLHVIQGFADLLNTKLDGVLDEQSQMEFGFIHNSVDDMVDKIDKLFLYADVLNRDQLLKRSETSINGLINLALARIAKPLEASGTSVVVSCAAGCEGLHAMADEKMLSIAIGHLLDNAVKFGPDGSEVRVHVELVDDDVEIAVEDDGEGFDLDRSATYLEGFGQSDGGLTRTSTGVGLGLTLANEITRAHGGALTLENASGGGGRVKLRFPRLVEVAAPRLNAATGL